MTNIPTPEYKPVIDAFLGENLDGAHQAVLFGERDARNRRTEYDTDTSAAFSALNEDARLTIVSFSTINPTYRAYVGLKALYGVSRFVVGNEEAEPYIAEAIDAGYESAHTIVIPQKIGRGAVLLDTLNYLRGHDGVKEFGSTAIASRLGPRQILCLDLALTGTTQIKQELVEDLSK